MPNDSAWPPAAPADPVPRWKVEQDKQGERSPAIEAEQPVVEAETPPTPEAAPQEAPAEAEAEAEGNNLETLSQETLDRIKAGEILDGLSILVRDVAIELMLDDDLGVLTEVAKHADWRRQVWELRKIDSDLNGTPFDDPEPGPFEAPQRAPAGEAAPA
jgi:hypothetical protein